MRTGTLATFLIIAALFTQTGYSIPIPENSETVNEPDNGHSRYQRNPRQYRRIAQAQNANNTTPQRPSAPAGVSNRQQTAPSRTVTRPAAPQRAGNVKNIRSVVGDNFIITLKRKHVDGEWEIAQYDRQVLDLVENRRSVRNTYFIFKPTKTGIALIKIQFKTRRAILETETYQVKVMSQAEFQQSISRAEDNQDRADRRRQDTGQPAAARSAEQVPITQGGEAAAPEGDNQNQETAESTQVNEETQLQLIKNLFERRAFGQAATEADDFMKKFQNSPHIVDVIITAGKSYSAINQHARAVELFKKYLEKVKNINVSYPVHFAMAESLVKSGNKADAQIAYIRMLTLFKDKPALLAQVHLLLGKLYLSQNNTALGIMELEKLITRFPEEGDTSAEAYYHLGRHYYKTPGMEDYEKSYRSFKKLITLFPESRFADPARRMARYLRMNYIEYR